jgi:hypothetical protein
VSIDGLNPATEYDYMLEPVIDGVSTPGEGGRARTLASRTPLTFAWAADTGPLPDVWARTAAALAGERPAFLVFGGDMPSYGTNDWQWEGNFFGRARHLMANVPVYGIMGNHDMGSPIFDMMFANPGGRNWEQRIDNMLMVGIDGLEDYSPGSANLAWLESVLSHCDAEFIFFFGHYPAWSSAGHGRLGADDEPVEPPVRQMRHSIYPLLQRYGVTACFNGHDHCFEHSELPGGVTAIASGGAGAYLYSKGERDNQNPYSLAFHSLHHYLLIRVEPGRCELTAKSLDGEAFYHLEFSPRQVD